MTAQDGLARAIVPAHTPLDGDLVFAAATGAVPLADPVGDLARLGDAAARVLARAVALGVYHASACRWRGRKPRGGIGSEDRRGFAIQSVCIAASSRVISNGR